MTIYTLYIQSYLKGIHILSLYKNTHRSGSVENKDLLVTKGGKVEKKVGNC